MRSPIHNSVSDGIFVARQWPLLGLDRNIWRGNKIKDFERNNPLKQFEVRQNKFDLLVYNAEKIGIQLIRINFTNDLLDEEHEELIQLLRRNDSESILEFIEEQRYELGNDIEEITFTEKNASFNNKITLSREGVLTIDSNEENPQNVISKESIGVLSGTFLPNFDDQGERRI